jgi:hypothetical protein
VAQPYENRFVAVFSIDIPSSAIISQLELRTIRRPDLVVAAGCVPRSLSAIGEECAGRALIIEHFSSALRYVERTRIINVSTSANLLYVDWKRSHRESSTWVAGERRPLVIVAAPSVPRTLIQAQLLHPDAKLQGIWRGLGPLAELLYICVHELDRRDPRWDQLRWAFPSRPGAELEHTRIFHDADAPSSLRNELLEVLMSEHIAVEDYEKLTLYERILEEGRAEGREAGRIEGREAGRIEGKLEVLSSALRQHLEPAEFNNLMAIKAPRGRLTAMEARFHALLATRSE